MRDRLYIIFILVTLLAISSSTVHSADSPFYLDVVNIDILIFASSNMLVAGMEKYILVTSSKPKTDPLSFRGFLDVFKNSWHNLQKIEAGVFHAIIKTVGYILLAIILIVVPIIIWGVLDNEKNRIFRKNLADPQLVVPLTDPPRVVPLSVRLRVLLFGLQNQFWYLFIGINVYVVLNFGVPSALYDISFLNGEIGVTEGNISAVIETNVEINDMCIHEYQYAYKVNNISYVGAIKRPSGLYKVNDLISIEYSVQNHTRSRIKGSIGIGLDLILPAIFLIIASLFIFPNIFNGLKCIRLLHDGKQAAGVLSSIEKTIWMVDDLPLFYFIFQFTADDQEIYRRIVMSDRIKCFDKETIRELKKKKNIGIVDADLRVSILYSPRNPSDAVILEELPVKPRINEKGEIEGSVPALILSLIIPLSILIYLTYLLLHLFEGL